MKYSIKKTFKTPKTILGLFIILWTLGIANIGNAMVMCTMEYDPVCWENGKTYSNECVATQQHNIKVKHKWKCSNTDKKNETINKTKKEEKKYNNKKTIPKQSIVACTREYKPVCWVDGSTYPNTCVAAQQHQVKIAYQGTCVKTGKEHKIPSSIHLSWDIDGDWINDCENNWSCGPTIDYTKPKTYNSKSNFLKEQWNICQVASDGCNTVHITNNGNAGASTMMYCQDIYWAHWQEQWSCKKYKDEFLEKRKEEYEDKNKNQSIKNQNKASQKIINKAYIIFKKYINSQNNKTETRIAKSLEMMDKTNNIFNQNKMNNIKNSKTLLEAIYKWLEKYKNNQITNWVKENKNIFVIKKPVLGGQWYITDVNIDNNNINISFEDGHIVSNTKIELLNWDNGSLEYNIQ